MPYSLPAGRQGWQRVDIRRRKFTRSARESELPIIPFGSQGEQNLRRGKGQCFHRVSEGGKGRRLSTRGGLETPDRIRELQRKLYRKAKQEPNLRFSLLYDKVYRGDILSYANRLVKANKGASGVDGLTFESVEEGARPPPMIRTSAFEPIPFSSD